MNLSITWERMASRPGTGLLIPSAYVNYKYGQPKSRSELMSATARRGITLIRTR